jgi:hypothetical protein
MATRPPTYDVGYRKPPKEHQFKKGQSGNKAGRPKRSRNVSTVLAEQLDRQVPVHGGSRKLLSLREGVMRRLVELALKGNIRAIELVHRFEANRAKMETDRDEQPVGGVLVVTRAELKEMWEQDAQALRETRRKEAEERKQEAEQKAKEALQKAKK